MGSLVSPVRNGFKGWCLGGGDFTVFGDGPGVRTSTHDAMVIRDGRIIDPTIGRDEVADLVIVGGVIAADAPAQAKVIDAAGWIVCPGLMDIHVHLREPGQAHKETIETGTAAAAAGGFTFVACMPNTNPPIDNVDTVRWVLERARRVNYCAVGPIATITRGRAGSELTDFAALVKAGAVAFSDDGDGVEDDEVMYAAGKKAAEVGVVLIQHCDYRELSAGGVMHPGAVARRLGLPTIDPRSEEAMIERDIAVSRETGGRCHIAHISTARGVDLVRQAKALDTPVTAEVCPHHLVLTDEACAAGDPNTKMNPPLRTRADVEACRRGLLDGTIDCIVSDHAPHTSEEKAAGFLKAPPGVVGLETAVALAGQAMIESGLADWARLVRWFTTGPANVLDRRRNPLEIGARADLTLLDPREKWIVRPHRFQSKGWNSPFAGWLVTGRPVGTIRSVRLALAVD